MVSVLVVVVLAAGLVFSPSVLEQVAVVVPGLDAGNVAKSQTQVCVWYTEAPHRELARRNRTGNTCPSPPVVPHSTTTTRCVNGGTWRYTGNDGVGWWYVSVCNPPPQQVCIWYTEAPHREIARRNRTGNTCPSPPVVPHSTTTTRCVNGGTWRYTGNDGVGWWYVSVCNPPPQQVCIWYTEAPHREIARRNRTGNTCPSPPVVPHSTTTTRCVNGGTWRYTGNDGVGWWYVSVCAPAAPTGLSCTAEATSIRFSWGSNGASRFRVSKDGGTTWVEPSPVTSTSHTFSGLAADTSYPLRVQAGKTSGATTAWSLSASRSCDTDARSQTSTAPAGVGCAATPFSIELSWTAADSADRYRVSKDGGATWIEPSPATSTSHTFSGLSAVTLYALSVQSGVDDGTATTWGAVSNKFCQTAFSTRPSGLECSATATTIEFSWDAVSGADTYTAVLEPAAPNGTRRRAEGITATSASFIALDPSTDYYLSVFTVEGGRQQLPAGKQCSTLAASANPDRPTCSAVTSNSVTLGWSTSTGVYRWYVARDVPGSSYADGSLLAPATLSKQFTGLSPNTTYQFAFWWKASSAGPWMKVLPSTRCTTTSATSPSPPTCGAVTADSVTLRLDPNSKVHQWYISRATVPDTAAATTKRTHTDGRTLGSATPSTKFDGLGHRTTYQFYFWWKASPTGSWNRVEPDVTCNTAALASHPAPPVCGTTTQDSAVLRWGANSSAGNWHIARPGTASALIDSRLLEARTLSATFTGLGASTSYEFPLWWQTSSASDWHQVRPDRTCTTQAAATTPISTICSATGKYCVTQGVYDAVLRAARKATTSPTGAQCTQTQLTASGRSQITPNMLASMMLAIQAWELNSGDTSRALSPMTLSRGDNMVNRTGDSNNIELYSHMTLGGYKRAHWNPGVGLWQLDNFTEPDAQVDALRYGHAERADVDKGGYEVAKLIRHKYCEGDPVFGRWFACNNGRCQNTHASRYVASTDSVQVETIEELADPTGGTRQRLCRWGTAGPAIACYLFDLSLKEGHALSCCPTGTAYRSDYTGGYNPYTPEAAPFISFTDTTTSTDFSTKYAVWPKAWPSSSAGLAWPTTTAAGPGEVAKTIIRAVRSAEGARFSPYNDDSNPARKGMAYHGLTKLTSETATQYEARIETEIARLNGGPLTVNNSADNYGFGEDGLGPEGWFDGTVNGRDLQIYNCPGAIGDTLVEACWVSTNGASSSTVQRGTTNG